jgi:SAM-dependent methyltransferase
MDIREKTAKYYDLWSLPYDDIPFYLDRIPSINSSVLELGCGTGRVLTQLANHCGSYHGMDNSEAMIHICHEKIQNTGIDIEKIITHTGGITNFHLDYTYDLIIAPYRVIQNLETDDQVTGIFNCIRNHLNQNGTCILNVFNPWPIDRIKESWGKKTEAFGWKKPYRNGYVTCHERREHFDSQRLILYPEFIYRYYIEDELIEMVNQKICMRFYYPDQFINLIKEKGFSIINCWGGYEGEPYGDGNELVVQFKDIVRQRFQRL